MSQNVKLMTQRHRPIRVIVILHQDGAMRKPLSALLTMCDGNPLVRIRYLLQIPVIYSFDIFLSTTKPLNKQLELSVIWDAMTLIWCHCNAIFFFLKCLTRPHENSFSLTFHINGPLCNTNIPIYKDIDEDKIFRWSMFSSWTPKWNSVNSLWCYIFHKKKYISPRIFLTRAILSNL